ncbi:MAG TPA: ParA family protein [Anaerolineae bacterium]
MARILALANIKGGVGKTTSTANLGAALVERGRQVLAVDLDPQASLTLALGFHPDELSKTVRHVLDCNPVPIESIILQSREDLRLAPANYGLGHAAHELETSPARLLVLRDALEPVRPQYDYILLDCPAGAGALTGAALVAADELIIPFAADYLGFQSLRLLLRIVKQVQANVNPNLRVAGIFYTMHNAQTRHAREIQRIAQETLDSGIPFFSSTIRTSVSLKEASAAGVSILRYVPESTAADAYRGLAREIDDAATLKLEGEQSHIPAQVGKLPTQKVQDAPPLAPAFSSAFASQDKTKESPQFDSQYKEARDTNRVLWSPIDEEPDRPPFDWRRLLLPIAIIIISLVLIYLSLQGKVP